MSNQGDYPNSAILFRNDKRGDNPKAPHGKGEGNIVIPAAFLLAQWDGQSDLTIPLDIASWTREAKNGAKFQTLTVRVKGTWRAQPAANPEPHPQNAEGDDDIPF